MRTIWTFILLLITLSASHLQASSWEEKTLSEMSPDEKIGQLFMIAGYVDEEFALKETKKTNAISYIQSLITDYSVGGIGLVGPSSSREQVELLNRYQQISKYPLLIAQDFEWGLSMRLKDGMRFPKNSTLGTIENNDLIYKMGKEIARQAKLVGVHMNFSPDLDVNIEPENLVINVRSFGACPQNVATKGISMIQGLQDGGIIASAKHFPGLGDITTDPHLGLPINKHEKSRLEAVELYPFAEAVKAGVLSIQTDHVYMPAFDKDLPSSLSPTIVQGILKDQMGFQGVVISGALRMQALVNHFTQEEITLKAFMAGSDLLLMPEDLPKAHMTIKKALQNGIITQEDIDKRVLKLLKLKKLAELDQKRITPLPIDAAANTDSAKELKKTLYKSAVKLLRDENKLLPVKSKALFIQIGEAPNSVLFDTVKNQIPLDPLFLSLEYEDEKALCDKVAGYPLIILAVYPADPRRIAEIRLMNAEKQAQELKNFRVHGLPASSIKIINALTTYQKKTIVNFFGNPFGQHFFDGFSTFIIGFEDDPDAIFAAASIYKQKF